MVVIWSRGTDKDMVDNGELNGLLEAMSSYTTSVSSGSRARVISKITKFGTRNHAKTLVPP